MTTWSDFKRAYSAGRKEIESRQRPLSVGWTLASAVGLGLALVVERILAARFLSDGFERTLFDFLASVLLFGFYLMWRWRLPNRRNKT